LFDIYAQKRAQDAIYRQSVELARSQKALTEKSSQTTQTASQTLLLQSKIPVIQASFTELLLENLNTKNFQLLGSLFENPPPKNITYANIESLIGQNPGQLLGKLSTHGGSHRKIEIGNIHGYFDSEEIVVTGGIVEPHGKAHSSTLAPAAIKMLRQILERAGITEQVLKQFKNPPPSAIHPHPEEPMVFSTVPKRKSITNTKNADLDIILADSVTLRSNT
jgi:hypothetical protein